MRSHKTPWGRANPKRGQNRRLVAVEFVRRFPIGEILTNEELDEFFEEQGLLDIPEERTVGSPEWTRHVRVRYIEKDKLNKAATHPEVARSGATPFYLHFTHSGKFYRVLDPVQAIAEFGAQERQDSNAKTRIHELRLIAQASEEYEEFEELTIKTQFSLLDSLNRFNQMLVVEKEIITRNLEREIEIIRSKKLSKGGE